jgi:hypothetical protein
MSVTEELLQRIDAEKDEYDQTIWPPATEETIDRLRAQARETLQTERCDSYIAFLRRNDGVDFNGYSIFGATEHKEPFLGGFIEANARLTDPPPRFVFYGETGHTLYAEDRTSRRWAALDRPSFDAVAEFDSFDAMLEHVLREALRSVKRGGMRGAPHESCSHPTSTARDDGLGSSKMQLVLRLARLLHLGRA